MADGLFVETRTEANELKKRWHEEGYVANIVPVAGGFRVYKGSGLQQAPSPLRDLGEEPEPSYTTGRRGAKTAEQKLYEARQVAGIKNIIQQEMETPAQKTLRQAKERKALAKATEEERIAGLTPEQRRAEAIEAARQEVIAKKQEKKEAALASLPSKGEIARGILLPGSPSGESLPALAGRVVTTKAAKAVVVAPSTAIQFTGGVTRSVASHMGGKRSQFKRHIPTTQGKHPNIGLSNPMTIGKGHIEPMEGSIGKGWGKEHV